MSNKLMSGLGVIGALFVVCLLAYFYYPGTCANSMEYSNVSWENIPVVDENERLLREKVTKVQHLALWHRRLPKVEAAGFTFHRDIPKHHFDSETVPDRVAHLVALEQES